MNDRQLHCLGKASEARSKARMARSKESERAFLEAAERWEREAAQEAVDYAAPKPRPPSDSNHAA